MAPRCRRIFREREWERKARKRGILLNGEEQRDTAGRLKGEANGNAKYYNEQSKGTTYSPATKTYFYVLF